MISQGSAKLRGEWVDPALGRIRFQDWVKRWQVTTNDLRPSTRARDEAYMRLYILDRFATTPLADIHQPEVQGWVSNLSARGLSPATVLKAHQLLGRALQGAVDAGLIVRSPCRAIRLPRVERQEMRFLTAEEVRDLAAAIHPRYRALVLLGGYGGLRIGELAGLRRSRIDLLHNRVTVSEVLVEVRGQLHTGPPKTRAGHRVVGIPHPICHVIEEHLAAWSGKDDHVFHGPEGGPLRVPLFRRRFWQPAVLQAGLPHRFPERQAGVCSCGQPKDSNSHKQPLRIHDLRHTAVALWIAAGANPKEVAARAGYTSVAFTLDRYGHLYPDADDRLQDTLGQIYAAAESVSEPSVLTIAR